jgi:hypothetical protein
MFKDKSDLDLLDPYLKSLLHLLANKPLEQTTTTNVETSKINTYLENVQSKKVKKGKKH